MEIPASYYGREQAFIKHTLLKTYLERLFMIIGQHEKKICYIDCFAGPWQESSPDLKDTSIAISLDIIEKCREGLRKIGKDVHFRALYVEKEPEPYCKLEAFLKERSKSGVETMAIKGEFIDLRDDILSWTGSNDFAFFFIDPKGWKNSVEIPTLRPLLQRPHSEFLVNFMYDFLLRTHTQEPFAEDIQAIFGEVPETRGMSPKEREFFLMKKYRNYLKFAQPALAKNPRAVSVSILDPVKDRTKYHLVYLTRHPFGIVVFMQESEKIDIIQRTVRAHTKLERRIEKSGQFEIFQDDFAGGNEDDRVDISDVKKYWLSKLSSNPKSFDIITLADMLEETGWFISDFQETFRGLENENRAKNLDAKRKRTVNVVNFDKGESLVKL